MEVIAGISIVIELIQNPSSTELIEIIILFEGLFIAKKRATSDKKAQAMAILNGFILSHSIPTKKGDIIYERVKIRKFNWKISELK